MVQQASSFLQRIGVQPPNPATQNAATTTALAADARASVPPNNPPLPGAAVATGGPVEGYGAAINPPESGTVAPAPDVAQGAPTFGAEAVTSAATPSAVAGPGRGKKGPRAAAPPATVGAEPSPLAASVSNFVGSPVTFDQSVYVAVIRGLYSNPAALAYTDAQIAERARAAAAFADGAA